MVERKARLFQRRAWIQGKNNFPVLPARSVTCVVNNSFYFIIYLFYFTLLYFILYRCLAEKKQVGGSRRCFILSELADDWRLLHFHVASSAAARDYLKSLSITIWGIPPLFWFLFSVSYGFVMLMEGSILQSSKSFGNSGLSLAWGTVFYHRTVFMLSVIVLQKGLKISLWSPLQRV